MGAKESGVCQMACCENEGNAQEMKFTTPREDENEVDEESRIGPLIQQQSSLSEQDAQTKSLDDQKLQPCRVELTQESQPLIGKWRRGHGESSNCSVHEKDGKLFIKWETTYHHPSTPLHWIPDGRLVIELAGRTHRATWDSTSCPQKLTWSDGEVWFKEGVPEPACLR